MAEYLVMTEGNSFYYVEGSGNNMNISSLGKHSSVELSKARLVVGVRLMGQGKKEFNENDLMSIVGHSLFFSIGQNLGRTSRVLSIFKKIR